MAYRRRYSRRRGRVGFRGRRSYGRRGSRLRRSGARRIGFRM